MVEHRPSIRSLIRGPRRCRADGLTWPCPTVTEAPHAWNGASPVPHTPPTDFIEAARGIFTADQIRRNQRDRW